jgi:anti-sigma regulatory factor (Ser/Thr protein kinase)
MTTDTARPTPLGPSASLAPTTTLTTGGRARAEQQPRDRPRTATESTIRSLTTPRSGGRVVVSVSSRTRTTVWEMPGVDAAVPVLRHAAEAELERWGVDGEPALIAVLAASELLANAVRYGGAEAGGLFLRLVQVAGRVRVEVRDHNQKLPVMGEGDTLAESGRGLLMLSVLPGSWGVELLDGGGKITFWESDDPADGVVIVHGAARRDIVEPVTGHRTPNGPSADARTVPGVPAPNAPTRDAVRPGTAPRYGRRGSSTAAVCGAVRGGPRMSCGLRARCPPDGVRNG